jgi:ubiquinone/menaquinone biosynthesis C-methylase UbiE
MDIQCTEDEGFRIPPYLTKTYWWAYVHPRAVHLFERQWLVNLILWGNFAHLRNVALNALGSPLDGRTLQIACVYGDLTERLIAQLGPDARLDVVDILPIQLRNLARKLPNPDGATLLLRNSAALQFEAASYDRALLFFLLHEQPEEIRRHTLAEALRVVKPGGQVVIVDYHRPRTLHPLYLPMAAILGVLEPFALDLWRHDITRWLPPGLPVGAISRRTFFGGLYQLVTITAQDTG